MDKKMKNYIFFTLGFILFLGIYFYNNPITDFKKDKTEGIQFHRENWSQVLEIAKKENKLIFLDIYATWCGPCKKLKSHTFSDQEVGRFYNQNFINVSLDGEKGEGAILANQFNLKGYPSLYFLDGDGKIILNTGGYLNSGEFLDLGKSVIRK